MAMTEAERWRSLAALSDYLCNGGLQSLPNEQACKLICELACATGMNLVVQQDGWSESISYGITQDNSRDTRVWQVEIPLKRIGGSSHLILFGSDRVLEKEQQAYTDALASVVDSILASRQVLQEERSQRVLAESLVEISRVLNSTLDLEEVLSLILDRLAELVPYDSANVMLLEDGRLCMHAVRGYKDITGTADMSKISFIPSRTALMGEVLDGNQPVILQDTREVPEWVWVSGSSHVRSWMGVPLRVKDQVIGLFSIDKGVPNFFTPRHSKLASALATHAALALANARIFAQLRETQEQLAGLSAQIMRTQEQERQRIAVELHDHAGQALLGLRAELKTLEHIIGEGPEPAYDRIKYLDSIVLEISQDLRRLAHDLRPPLLTELGLIPALEQFIEEFGRRMVIPVTFEYQHQWQTDRLPENIELVCYRIVQEALTNLAKHAQASKAKIQLDRRENRLILSVTDDGVGFTPQVHKDIEGFGLIGIRERVTAVGGLLQVYSQPGRGTQVLVEIPL